MKLLLQLTGATSLELPYSTFCCRTCWNASSQLFTAVEVRIEPSTSRLARRIALPTLCLRRDSTPLFSLYLSLYPDLRIHSAQSCCLFTRCSTRAVLTFSVLATNRGTEFKSQLMIETNKIIFYIKISDQK